MKNNIIITLIALFFSFNSIGQEKAYKLDFQIEGLKDTIVNLSYFFGSNFYYKDTTQVDSEGNFSFTGDEPLEEGMYAIIKGQDKLFDFFVDKQEFEMKTELINPVQEMEVEDSPENEIFYEYLVYLKEKQKIAADLVEKQKAETEGSKSYNKIEKELEKLDKEVIDFIEDFKEDNEGTFTVKFLKSMEYPELPKVEEGAKVDSALQLQYLRDHAFDNIDFSDERMLRIPTYHEKIMYFMNSLTYFEPDSIIKSIDYIIDKTEANPEVYKYTLNFLTSHYQKSERMGTDAVFVHMAKNYYLNDKTPWVGEKDISKIHERATAMEPLLIGKKAPNIIVKDTAQEKTLRLYDVDAKYTIVYIWSPECGHCKVTTPELLEIYHKNKDKGVEVFAVGNEFENEAWLEYIRKNNLDWINGSDGKTFRSNFRTQYDVYSTPQTYLLDKDKKIIAKKMNMESLEKILEYQMKKDEKAEVNEQ